MTIQSKPNRFAFSRKVRLGLALGDWTTLRLNPSEGDDVSVSQVRNVNFDSLPKESLRYFHYLHYRLAERICALLEEDLDIKVELHSVVGGQSSYEDFLKAQRPKVVQAELTLDRLGSVNVILDWSLAEMMVDRLVGGKGVSDDLEQFSSTDAEILKTEVRRFVLPFSEVWKGIIPEKTVDISFNMGPFLHDRRFSLREAYVTFTFFLYFGESEPVQLTFAYPNHVLKRLHTIKSSRPDPIKKRLLLTDPLMRAVKVPIRVELGRATVAMRDIRSLQIGDVVRLDSRMDESLDIELGGRVLLKGQPGVSGRKLVIQVTGRVGDSAGFVRARAAVTLDRLIESTQRVPAPEFEVPPMIVTPMIEPPLTVSPAIHDDEDDALHDENDPIESSWATETETETEAEAEAEAEPQEDPETDPAWESQSEAPSAFDAWDTTTTVGEPAPSETEPSPVAAEEGEHEFDDFSWDDFDEEDPKK